MAMTSDPGTELRGRREGKLTELFGIDPRGLAVFRMALGVLLLVDLAIRVGDLRAMYTDDGVLSVEWSMRAQHAWNWSLHWLSGELWLQGVLFALAAVFALALLLGFWTRLSTVVSWVLLCSLHVRMPLVLNDGDVLLRLLLFWGMFLPLGQVWSLDTLRRGGAAAKDAFKPIVSMATAGALLQVFLVYWFTGVSKLNESWLGFDPQQLSHLLTNPGQLSLGGDALSLICAQGIYATSVGQFLLDFPTLLKVFSLSIVLLESIGPWFLFYPWYTRYFRMVLVPCFLALLVAIELTLYVGLFAYVAMAAWVLFLPSSFWSSRWVEKLTGLVRLPQAVRRFVAPSADQAEPRRRGRELPSSDRFKKACHPAASVACALALLLIVVWNLAHNLQDETRLAIHQRLAPLASATMLHQAWSTNGQPSKADYWYMYRAELSNGEVVDLLRGVPVDEETMMHKPPRFATVFPNHRWRVMHHELIGRDESFRHPVAKYVCSRWNASHAPQRRIVQLDMLCFREPLDGTTPKMQLASFARVVPAMLELMPPPRVEE